MTNDPPQSSATAKANTTDGNVDLGFKVTPAFHRRYKMASAMAGTSMKDIMEQGFELWLAEKGLTI